MAGNSEIEKLERRWRDNPQGTGFAPYAEALRKHGNHALAREVLRQGLENHPNHIPGNIVLGRCALDVGEDASAEQAFSHALSLDQENVIALKALADITERQGRLVEAGSWLAQLIAVDPSNDEAQEQLARVSTARELAAAVLVTRLDPSPEPAREPQPLPVEAEIGSGQIEEDVDSALDAAFESHFPPAPPPTAVRPIAPPLELHHLAAESARPEDATLPLIPVGGRPPLPPASPETQEFEPAGSGGDVEPPDDFEPLEAFAPSASGPSAPAGPDEFALEDEHPPAIELRPSGSSEFQAPDASGELLTASPGRSEFQTPDASAEISVEGSGGQEFQPPSGADELLARYSSPAHHPPAAPPAPAEPPPAETPPAWASTGNTSGYASMPVSPTEEFPVDLPAPAAMTPAAWQIPASEEVSAPINEAVAAGPVAGEIDAAAPAASEEPPATEPAAAGSSDLQLIYPEDVAAPPPARPLYALSEPVSLEPAVGEPEPVVTESMAELYARQGHTLEALEVYRALLARSPRDARLAEKVADLEQAAAPVAARRRAYAASATGGESVESFFRAMVEARPEGAPAGEGARLQPRPDDGQPGAPTRPTNDPLSLSAIFGEDHPVGPAPAVSPAPQAGPSGAAPRSGGLPAAFSFDQFFGGPPGAPGDATRPGPGGEDLDQFQNWLKSLKR